tara:strand:+ start:10636 stop:12099 length:1464 start_codon:yes stop_codon:yes gene_type:complete
MNITKYKYIILLFLSTILSDIFHAKANIELEFNNRIFQGNVIKSYPFQETRYDIGLFYDFSWDKNKKQIIIKRDKNNYPVIRFSLFDKKNFPQGISVKKYNDLNLSKVSDKKIVELHKKNDEAKITLNSNKVINLKPYDYDYNDIKLSSFNLDYINNIDTNKGLLEISFRADFTNKRPELNKFAKDLLKDDFYQAMNENAPYPIQTVEIKEYKYDVDIRKGVNTPDIANRSQIDFTYDNGEVRTVRQESGIGQFRQTFDFKNFPFDKQILKIKIASGARSTANINETWPKTGKAAVHFITPAEGAFLGLENYLINVSENYLKEWTVKNINIESDEIIVENFYNKYLDKTHSYNENSIDLILNIERNSAHYIYKIIIPIFLILSIAWYVLWIPTEKLDARLTTSIVALLALIAYNFVFLDDIPKLNYLTALDWYIFLSYIWCCIPTFMSIGFSKFIVKNQRIVITINKKLRFWLGVIYLIFTLQIFSF